MAQAALSRPTAQPAAKIPYIPRTMAEFHGVASGAQSLAELSEMFAAMIAEIGFSSHCCITVGEDHADPRFGDVAYLPRTLLPLLDRVEACGRHHADDILILPVESWHEETLVLCLFGRRDSLDVRDAARLCGWAEVYATYGLALLESEGDIPTASGLGLVQRQCLAQSLMGLSDVDIADSLSLTPLTVRSYLDDAVVRLGVSTRSEAVSLAARRGWLASINLSFTLDSQKQ